MTKVQMDMAPTTLSSELVPAATLAVGSARGFDTSTLASGVP